jgi:hypothetical protein
MRYLHISRNIERYLDRLRTYGKHGVLAASQYLQIIDYIRQAKWRSDMINCKRTKNGEYRLKNCIKYDLGHGYRLVTVKDGDNLFIPFAGSHDETDRWIATHRYDSFCEDDSLYISEMIIEDETIIAGESPEPLPSSSPCEAGEYEEQLLEKIDDGVLKMVFPGLYR